MISIAAPELSGDPNHHLRGNKWYVRHWWLAQVELDQYWPAIPIVFPSANETSPKRKHLLMICRLTRWSLPDCFTSSVYLVWQLAASGISSVVCHTQSFQAVEWTP